MDLSFNDSVNTRGIKFLILNFISLIYVNEFIARLIRYDDF